MSGGRSWRASAKAKINLGLAVLGRRADGYHDLDSVFVRLALADDLTVSLAGLRPTADPDADMLAIAGPRPTDDPAADLVLRAAGLLRARAGRPLPALAFRLTKRIPLAAGLGGGSSDAAAALRLAAAAWALRVGPEERRELAAQLGSDVPFFTARRVAARIEGRGERVVPVAPPAILGVLLVRTPWRLETGAVFSAFDRLGGARPGGRSRPDPPLTVADAIARAERDGNDLWPAAAALCPGLPELRRRLALELGRPIFMTGSGPTLVALYPSLTAARRAAGQAKRAIDGSGATVIATRVA